MEFLYRPTQRAAMIICVSRHKQSDGVRGERQTHSTRLPWESRLISQNLCALFATGSRAHRHSRKCFAGPSHGEIHGVARSLICQPWVPVTTQSIEWGRRSFSLSCIGNRRRKNLALQGLSSCVAFMATKQANPGAMEAGTCHCARSSSSASFVCEGLNSIEYGPTKTRSQVSRFVTVSKAHLSPLGELLYELNHTEPAGLLAEVSDIGSVRKRTPT